MRWGRLDRREKASGQYSCAILLLVKSTATAGVRFRVTQIELS
jgi:hypothetical protein